MRADLLDSYSRRPMPYNPRPLFDRENVGATERASDYARNPVAWAREVLDFHPDLIQQRVLDPSIQRGILNCSRQWGKSTITAIKAIHHAIFHPESLILVSAPSLRQSGEFLEKSEPFLRKLEIPIKGDGKNAVSLKLPNGSRLIGLPQQQHTTRGFSRPALLIIDEASRVSDATYHSLLPTLSTGNGALWLMSTPNGKSGFFYDEWTSNRPWTRIQATAAECPRITSEFLAEQRDRMPEPQYREEYCCEFVNGDGALFNAERLESLLSDDVEALW